MNIVIFDTETISTTKPFCYNIGYVIADTENRTTLVKHDFVVSETWNNKMLFNTAYYCDKQETYISRMKGKTVIKKKWLDIISLMAQEFETYNVEHAYAYNSDFDERVFTFNSEWFKTFNPIETLEVHDIRAFAHEVICKTTDYVDFCEQNNLFTESGNYSSTAESVYKFVSNDVDFVEQHTALADSIIETDILLYCVELGCNLLEHYKVQRTLPRKTLQQLVIKDRNGELYCFDYFTKTTRNGTIYLK
jgi:hypothetical protein